MDKASSASRDPNELLAIIAQLEEDAALKDAAIAEVKAENDQLKDALAASQDEVQRLDHIVDMYNRHRYGPRSEPLDPDQYQLILEEIEAARSAAEQDVESKERAAGRSPGTKRRNNRGALPANLDRIEQIVDVEDKTCASCGGGLHLIGEDVSERLDVVPKQVRVLVTRRPRYGCRGCDEGGVVQAPAPNWIIDSGLPTDRLVAQVVVSRFADHLPLYRQAQTIAAKASIWIAPRSLIGSEERDGG